MTRACLTCEWWDSRPAPDEEPYEPTAEDVGVCRHAPPRILGEVSIDGEWPMTQGAEWCREWQRRES